MSCIPNSWQHNKKRERSSHEDTCTKRPKKCNGDLERLVSMFIREIISAEQVVTADSYLETETLPAHFLTESMPFAVKLRDFDHSSSKNVPLVTRQYEEEYLRERFSKSEQACSMGANCECMFIDQQQPFVGVSFRIPDLGREESKQNDLCLLCLRKHTLLLFHHIVRNGRKVNGLIQKYGNICGEAGEYHPSVMLICPPSSQANCMPLPIVAHQRNRYEVIKTNGIHYLKQINVANEDFR